MPTDNRWQITNETLTLTKGAAGLEAFDFLFSVMAAETNQIQITKAVANLPDQSGIVVIQGQAETWNAPDTQVTLTYRQETDRILELKLGKAFPGLKLPETLTNHVQFRNLQQVAMVTVPDDGTAPTGTFARKIEGQLQLEDKIINISSDHLSPPYFIKTHIETGLGLSDLVHLFGHADNPHKDLDDWLPADLWPQSGASYQFLTLTDLIFQIDPADDDILIDVSARVALFQKDSATIAAPTSLEHTWTVINDLPGTGIDALSVRKIWVEIEVEYPLSEYRFPTLEVGGELEIAGGLLDITARWPDFDIHGELQHGSEIKIGHLLQHFGLLTETNSQDTPKGHEGFSNLAINQMWFNTDPSAPVKSFSFSIGLADIWSLSLSTTQAFNLGELTVHLDYMAGHDTVSTSYNLSLTAKLQIASVQLFLIAQYQGSGWQFEGGIQPASELKLGELFADIARKFGVDGIPYSISHLVLENLRLSFNTATKDFTFTCAGQLPIHDNKTIHARVTIRLAHQGEGRFTRDIDGYLAIDAYVFDLHLEQTQHSNLLAASYRHQSESEPLRVKQLLLAVSDSDFIKHDIPDLEIDLQDILFAFATSDAAAASGNGAAPSQTASKFLFGLDLGAEINLADLPLVGKEFPADQTPGIESLKILYATASFTSSEVAAINRLLPDGVKTLPAAASGGRAPEIALPQGFNVGAVLKLGIETTSFSLPALAPNQASSNQGATPDAPATRATDDATWITILKNPRPDRFRKDRRAVSSGQALVPAQRGAVGGRPDHRAGWPGRRLGAQAVRARVQLARPGDRLPQRLTRDRRGLFAPAGAGRAGAV